MSEFQNPPSFVKPEEFAHYFASIPTNKMPKLKETTSLIPVPVGVPFLAYYYNKKLHTSWTYSATHGFKEQALPRIKKDIGAHWLKPKSKTTHHDWIIGIATLFLEECGSISNMSDKSIIRAIKTAIKSPETSDVKIRYVAIATQYSVLPDKTVPNGDPEWQMRAIHQYSFRSAIQLPKTAKAFNKKLPRVHYQHLNGGWQINSLRLPPSEVPKALIDLQKIQKKLGRFPIVGYKLVGATNSFGDKPLPIISA